MAARYYGHGNRFHGILRSSERLTLLGPSSLEAHAGMGGTNQSHYDSIPTHSAKKQGLQVDTFSKGMFTNLYVSILHLPWIFVQCIVEFAVKETSDCQDSIFVFQR